MGGELSNFSVGGGPPANGYNQSMLGSFKQQK